MLKKLIVTAFFSFLTITSSNASQEMRMTDKEIQIIQISERFPITDNLLGIPKKCLEEAVRDGVTECTTQEGIQGVEVSFPINIKFQVREITISFSERGFMVESIRRTEKREDWLITFLLVIPCVGILFVSILNAHHNTRRKLFVFYIAILMVILASAFLGALAGGSIGGLAGVFVGAFAGTFAGAPESDVKLAGTFAGTFAGAFTGMFVGLVGWGNADTARYIVFLAIACAVSFLIREILAYNAYKKKKK